MTNILNTLFDHSKENEICIVEDLYNKGRELEYVENDPTKAVKYYRLAASEGYKPAQTALAMLYMRGHGVRENKRLACQWLEKANQLKLIKLLENF